MFNELIFVAHVFIIILFLLICQRIGREALMGFVWVQYILANFFILKQTTLFGLTVTCTDPFMIGALLGLNIIQEFYGMESTKKTITVGFMLLLFYLLATIVHLQYLPDMHDTMQPHFMAILGFMPRIVIASFFVYLIVQYIDAALFRWFKRTLSTTSLTVRSTLSIGISQLIDTILFTFLGLYGLVANPWHIIGISYAIKLITLGLSMPFMLFIRRMKS